MKLTKEEQEKIQKFRFEIIHANGGKWANGSYSEVDVDDVEMDYLEADGEDTEMLILDCMYGTVDGDGSREDRWKVKMNRKTLEITDY